MNKTFTTRPGRLLNVLRTFKLRPVSAGLMTFSHSEYEFQHLNVKANASVALLAISSIVSIEQGILLQRF